MAPHRGGPEDDGHVVGREVLVGARVARSIPAGPVLVRPSARVSLARRDPLVDDPRHGPEAAAGLDLRLPVSADGWAFAGVEGGWSALAGEALLVVRVGVGARGG